MINKYNNPNLITYMFSTLFPFGISVHEMNNKPIFTIDKPIWNTWWS
jgi:hypothetical protein